MNDKVSPKRPAATRLERQAYVVLGMHRSGTSALTRLLSLAGAALPSSLMPAGKDNPKGFWESTAISELNDEILDSVDSEWDDVFALRPRPFLANFDTAFLSRAVETLEADFGAANPIVLKDPRVSILAPFWARALREFGADPRFVIAVRNPIEVANSLMARNQMPLAKSALVWASYMIAAERDTRNEKRVFVSYDALLLDWRAQVQRIEEQTGVPLPRMTSRTASEIDGFINADDRHHRADPKALDRRRDIPNWVQSVADWLDDATRDTPRPSADMDYLAQNLLGAEETFGTVIADSRARLNGLKRDLTEALGRVQKHEWEIKDLQKIIAENTDIATKELERRDAERASDIARLQAELARVETEWHAERAGAQSLLSGKDDELQRITEELQTLKNDQIDRQSLHDQIEQLAAERDREHARAEKIIEEMQSALAAERANLNSLQLRFEEEAPVHAASLTAEANRRIEELTSSLVAANAALETTRQEQQRLVLERDNAERLVEAERAISRGEFDRRDAELALERQLAAAEIDRLNQITASYASSSFAQTSRLSEEFAASLAALKGEREALEDERAALRAQLNQQASVVADLEARSRQLADELAAANELVASERDIASNEYRRRDQEIETERAIARAEFERLGASITALEQQIAPLNESLANAVATNAKDGESARAEIERLQDLIESTQARASRAETSLNETLSALEAAAAENRQNAAKLDAQFAEIAARDDLLRSAIAQFDQERMRWDTEKHDWQDRLLAEQAAVSTLRAELVGQLDALRAERDTLTDRAAALQDQIDTERESARSQIERLTSSLDSAETLLATERELARAEYDRRDADLVGERESAAAEFTRLNALREQLETEKLALTRNLDGAHALLASERELARAEYGRRDAEIAAERQAVLAERAATEAMVADLSRRMTDRSRETVVLSQELEAIRQSTSWKMTDPMRRFLGANRGLALASRRALKLVWWTVTFQLPGKLAARGSALPSPTDAPAAPIADRPLAALVAPADPVDLNTRPPAADLSGLIKELRDEFGPSAPIGWLEGHATDFGLPFDPNGGKTPKWELTDTEARILAGRVRDMASGWPEAPDTPDVSIVIPVYNQLAFTLSCIASLFANATRYSFEVIVGDDASSDQTATILAEGLPRTRTVRQATNGGFIKNCNAAAASARGRVIVLLNNDTITLPGWLDELVGTLDDPSIGMSGSKLLYPDGRLQEAGGIVWRDASAWNLGRLDQARRPEYSYRRDVDYMSGASIALRTETWRLLRGFDDWYDIAYGEDSDLAFRVRQIGLRTTLQPLSMLVHFEGVSAGTDTGEGMKAYQIGNARKLAERWAPVLASHRPNADAPELEKERSVTKRVLFIDACTPEPDKDAGSLTCLEMMRAFQKNGYKVTFIPEDNFLFMPQETRALQREGIEAVYWPFYGSVDDYLQRTGTLYEAVVIFRVGTAAKHIPTIRKRCPQARILFHTSDVHFVREEREAAISGNAAMADRARATRNKELGVINSADLTILHSTFEASVLAQAAPDARAYVFPWILDPKPRGLGPQGRSDMMFLGGYRHGPNVDAVKHFVTDIWPMVRAELPDARFHIVGSEAPAELRSMDGRNGVVFVGHVPDLEDAFRSIRLTVASIRFGAGIKGKVAMSLAYGVPSVMTTCAAEGMGLNDGEEALIADDPAVFASRVVALYRDDALWMKLSDAGLKFVNETYGSALGKRRVGEMLSLAGVVQR